MYYIEGITKLKEPAAKTFYRCFLWEMSARNHFLCHLKRLLQWERENINRCFLWEMSARNHFLYHLNVVFSERKVLLSARPMPALACRPRRRIPVRAEKKREREREREREMFLFFSFFCSHIQTLLRDDERTIFLHLPCPVRFVMINRTMLALWRRISSLAITKVDVGTTL